VTAGMGVRGGARDRGGPRYRRRRPLPAMILVLVLAVVATIVWLRVIETDSEPVAATHCDPPTSHPTPSPGVAPPTLGKALENAALDRVSPAPPDKVLVKVLNASSQRGEARLVTANLRSLGFTQVAEPDNDQLYGDSMSCRAQIRFGPQGTAAARTLSLVEPCAELIRDDRTDATVDVAIGNGFDDLKLSSQARTVLQQLSEWSAAHPQDNGGLQANAPKPELDHGLLTAARQVRC
jgi:LytR cell envelope-related transcriptional attenuator